MIHVPCCLLSVSCGYCYAPPGGECAEDCDFAAYCNCHEYADECCDRHFAPDGDGEVVA